MVNVGNYNFKSITDKTIDPEESFVNLYVYERLESYSAISSTHMMHIILDTKYKEADLNKVMTKQCQHRTATERHRLLKFLKKF